VECLKVFQTRDQQSEIRLSTYLELHTQGRLEITPVMGTLQKPTARHTLTSMTGLSVFGAGFSKYLFY